MPTNGARQHAPGSRKKWKDLVSLSIIRLYTERKEKMNASREQSTQNCHRILCQRRKKKKDALDRLTDIQLHKGIKPKRTLI